jgi:hypothetical protein
MRSDGLTLHFWFGDFPSARTIDMEVVQKNDRRLSSPQVIYCDGVLPACSLNNTGNTSICNACIARTKYHHSLLQISTVMVPLSSLIEDRILLDLKSLDHDCMTPDFLVTLVEPIAGIGRGALSSTISTTRDKSLTSETARELASKFLKSALLIHSAVTVAIDIYSPKSLVVHNGRLAEYHAVYLTALHNHIDVFTHEVCTPYYGWYLFKNGRIHDIQHYHDLIEFSTQSVTAEKMESVASDFFNEKRSRKALHENFTKHQTVGHRSYSKDNRKTVTIFTSSEDEFAAIGPEWDFPLFTTQHEAISWIIDELSSVDEKVFVIVRMHPNMIKMHESDLRPYTSLLNKGVEVIWPDSVVDSYAVMDDADVVITFGSTIGLEAVYWDKTVIELGHSLFEHLDVCYKPSTRQEVIQLICNPPQPKPKRNLLPYVYTVCHGGYPFYSVNFGSDGYTINGKQGFYPTNGKFDSLAGLSRSVAWLRFLFICRDVAGLVSWRLRRLR